MKSFSVNQDFSVVILNINAHFAETGDGGKAVSSFQKMGDLCGSFGKGTEHDGTVGDGFVAWDCKSLRGDWLSFFISIIIVP